MKKYFCKLTYEQFLEFEKIRTENDHYLPALVIKNETDEEILEKVNHLFSATEKPLIFYEPVDSENNILDVFEILNDKHLRKQLQSLIDLSNAHNNSLSISVLSHNGATKEFFKKQSFRKHLKTFLLNKIDNKTPIYFYSSGMESVTVAYNIFSKIIRTLSIYREMDEIYSYAGLQDMMSSLSFSELRPLCAQLHNTITGQGFFARRSKSKVMYTIYPKQDIEEVTRRALQALQNVYSAEMTSESFVLDLSKLDKDVFLKYLKSIKARFEMFADVKARVRRLLSENKLDEAIKETPYIPRAGASLTSGVENYRYNFNILFYSFSAAASRGYREVYSIRKVDGYLPRYIFEYENTSKGVKASLSKSEEEYKAFLRKIKKITKEWLPQYLLRVRDGSTQEIVCREISLRTHLSMSYPDNFDEFENLLKEFFPQVSNAPRIL